MGQSHAPQRSHLECTPSLSATSGISTSTITSAHRSRSSNWTRLEGAAPAEAPPGDPRGLAAAPTAAWAGEAGAALASPAAAAACGEPCCPGGAAAAPSCCARCPGCWACCAGASTSIACSRASSCCKVGQSRKGLAPRHIRLSQTAASHCTRSSWTATQQLQQRQRQHWDHRCQRTAGEQPDQRTCEITPGCVFSMSMVGTSGTECRRGMPGRGGSTGWLGDGPPAARGVMDKQLCIPASQPLALASQQSLGAKTSPDS